MPEFKNVPKSQVIEHHVTDAEDERAGGPIQVLAHGAQQAVTGVLLIIRIPQYNDEHGQVHQHHRPAADSTGPTGQAPSAARSPGKVQGHDAQVEAQRLREEPDCRGQREEEVARAQIQAQGQQHGLYRGLPRFDDEMNTYPDPGEAETEADQPVRRRGAEEQGEGQQDVRREWGKADIVPALIDGQLQPGIVLPEIEPPVQPGVCLQRVAVIPIHVPCPASRHGGHDSQNQQKTACRTEVWQAVSEKALNGRH